MPGDLEGELNETPAVEMATSRQRDYIERLLEEKDVDLRDALVEADIEGADEIREVDDLNKAQAILLIGWLKDLPS